MLYQDRASTATEALMVPSPLYAYIVHVVDAMGHMSTLIADQSCRLIIIYKIGLQ